MREHPSVGLVGLGLVGQALANRLREAGIDTWGFDIAPSACAAYAATGGQLAASVPELASRVKVLLLAVFDTTGVLQVLEGPGGALPLPPGPGLLMETVIDCSTGNPDELALLSARLARRGIRFIEAPLSGSSSQIAAGEATMLLGGQEDDIAAVTPLLQALSPYRIHVGAAGMGARGKLATNLVLGLNRAALAEGMVFAERMGIAPSQFLQLVLNTPARSDAARHKGAMMVSGEFPPQSRIRQHLKDVRLMLADAHAHGQDLPLSRVHARLMASALDAGDGELDNAAIIRQIRREVSS